MSYDPQTGYYIGYIYRIDNLVNGKIYIGQTTTTVENRFKEHLNHSRCEKPEIIIDRAIKKYGDNNFRVVKLLSIHNKDYYLMKDDLDEFESLMIKANNSNIHTGNGYNIASGGTCGQIHFKPITVYDLKGNFIEELPSPKIAADHYETVPEVVNDICKGKRFNHRNQIVFRFKNDSFDLYPVKNDKFHFAEIDISKGYDPSIGCYCLVDVYNRDTGKFLGTYDSLAECGRIYGVLSCSISSVCSGALKSIHGYVFRYHGDSIDKYEYKPQFDSSKRQVNQYSLDDKYINTYDSMSEAVRSINAKYRCNIRSCCRKEQKQAYGFKWFFSSDPSQPDKSKIIPKE